VKPPRKIPIILTTSLSKNISTLLLLNKSFGNYSTLIYATIASNKLKRTFLRKLSYFRECVKLVMTHESNQLWFYDQVMLLESSTKISNPILFPILSDSKMSSKNNKNSHNNNVTNMCRFSSLNKDSNHKTWTIYSEISNNFLPSSLPNIDSVTCHRYWVDILFRGALEDYYFNRNISNLLNTLFDNYLTCNDYSRYKDITDADISHLAYHYLEQISILRNITTLHV
jgi:hypothetical protein